ncbi:MAG: ATP-binding protein [Candidatus Margulisbacteria bacterium]|jgi:hypothetical protein|nr:ATP-binding protein [Candidatus Margulisiibacteriota bacterium]
MHYALTDFLQDIFQNSVEAQAGLIVIDLIEDPEKYLIYVADNGRGMSQAVLRQALDPFFTSGEKHRRRRVGLGLAFLNQAVKAVDGDFEIKSEEGTGTSVVFSFPKKHLDCPPLGDLPGTLLLMFAYPGAYELNVTRQLNGQKYTVLRSELQAAAGDWTDAQSLKLAGAYLAGLEEDLMLSSGAPGG